MDIALKEMAASLPTGAEYVPQFISSAQESDVAKLLDGGVWSDELKRRVQHFGYRYDYRARAVTSDAYLGRLPDWLETLGRRLVATGHFDEMPDQVIANEYMPGQGISAHVDCEPCFGDTIASLSLLSSCEMVFREKGSGASLGALLAPCSLIVMKDSARHAWTHEIPARKSDIVDGNRIARSRRISLTFRNVIRAI